MMNTLPQDFLVGAATAAHQVEGNNIHSDYWAMEHMKYGNFNEPSLDAVDHYNRYEEDIKMVAEAGLNAYRFSIEWARIEPKQGVYDENEIEHYRKVLTCCRENGVEPIVTMMHFTSPKWLIENGGWENEATVEAFKNYCQYVTEQLGDLMHYVCTINEANMGIQVAAISARYRAQMMAKMQRMQQGGAEEKKDLDEHQMTAVKEAVRNGLLIITGGPGTGKTTTINTIIKYFEMEGLDIFLAAPTGRAAKRMSETTGFEARTIHRMLELNGGVDGAAGFERNEQNPLETDVVIIDEMSMVDISLMHALLKAVAVGTRLILVGDVNQLPSVGPGSVLRDIIRSHECNVVMLTKIFRQASTSDIIVNAHKINQGEEVTLDNKSMDFFFLKRYDADVIISVVLQLIKQKLPKFVDATPYDIQVLTPMRKGLLGVERLNGILQRYLNPPSPQKREKEHGDILFREGDKIMQTRNNYQLEWEIRTKYGLSVDKGTGVFNGDMGIVREINDFAETMTVEFDEGRMVEYPYKLLDELELAYAITIHKSQGSEYPAVVIPLLSGPSMLMNRNLLYTAVTRARKCVTLVGNEVTFEQMVQNTSQQKRYSGLCDRLKEA